MRTVLALLVSLIVVNAAAAHGGAKYGGQAGVSLSVFRHRYYPAGGFAAPAYSAAPSYSYFAAPAAGFAPSYFTPSAAPAFSFSSPWPSYAPSAAPMSFAMPGGCYGSSAGFSSFPSAAFGDPAAGLPIGSILSILDVVDRIAQRTGRTQTGGDTTAGRDVKGLRDDVDELKKAVRELKASGVGDTPSKIDELRKEIDKRDIRLGKEAAAEARGEIKAALKELRKEISADTKTAIDEAIKELKKANPTLK